MLIAHNPICNAYLQCLVAFIIQFVENKIICFDLVQRCFDNLILTVVDSNYMKKQIAVFVGHPHSSGWQ
jgi:hypothetical protein